MLTINENVCMLKVLIIFKYLHFYMHRRNAEVIVSIKKILLRFRQHLLWHQ